MPNADACQPSSKDVAAGTRTDLLRATVVARIRARVICTDRPTMDGVSPATCNMQQAYSIQHTTRAPLELRRSIHRMLDGATLLGLAGGPIIAANLTHL